MSPLPIPEDPGAFTNQWLTVALRKTGTVRAAAIEAFALEALGGHPGLIGNLVRVRPSYDCPVEPETLRTEMQVGRARSDGNR